MPSLRALAAVPLACIALLSCDSPTEGGAAAPRLAAGATVTGHLQRGDTAVYRVEAMTAPVSLLLQARSGGPADTLTAELLNASGTVVERVSSVGTDTSLVMQATELRQVPQGESWRVRVRGHSGDDAGPYALRLYVFDPAPESVPSAIQIGQTVEGERLEVDGDVDEFTVEGRAGETWILFGQYMGEWGPLGMELVDPVGARMGSLAAYQRSGGLEDSATGRVVLPRAGTYRVRVSTPSPLARGLYRFRLDAVDRGPETAPATLTPGVVAEEAIGSVGDIDEFTFSIGAPMQVNLFFQLRTGLAAGVVMELLRGEQVLGRTTLWGPTGSIDDVATGPVALTEAGTYTVRVSGAPGASQQAATGTYRLEMYPIDPRPETGAAVAVDGPPAAGALDRPGDRDDYAFQARQGQHLIVQLSGQGSAVAVRASLKGPAGNELSSTHQDGPGTAYAKRVTIAATGTYVVSVDAPTFRLQATGPYTVRVYSVNFEPEHVPATIGLGQVVTGERIDYPGDVDVFTFRGPAGAEVDLFAGADGGAVMAWVPPVEGESFFRWVNSQQPELDVRSTGRFRLLDATYSVMVEGEPTVGYRLRLHPIDRRPEGRAAAYTLGDTIRGESVYPMSDIDEYTFTLAAAATLTLHWKTSIPPPSPPTSLVHVHFVNDATGEDLVAFLDRAENPVPILVQLAAGRYRLRVWHPYLIGSSSTAEANRHREVRYEIALTP